MSLNPEVSKIGINPDNDPGTQIRDLPIEMLARVMGYLNSENREKLRSVFSEWNHVLGRFLETQIRDLPIEMLAEVLDYLSSENRQKLRSVSSSWNYVIGRLFETTLHVNKNNMAVLLKTVARFLHVEIGSSALDQLSREDNRSSFCSCVQKLKLQVDKRDLSCFRMMQNFSSLKELILNDHLDWRSSEDLNIPELEQTLLQSSSTWLPELKTLTFYSENVKMLKLFKNILQKGGLENLTIGGPLPFSEVALKLFGQNWETSANIATGFLVKIIEANKKTLKKFDWGCDLGLEFNPRSTDKCYLRKLRGALVFQPGAIVETADTQFWLRTLNDQECLRELNFKFFQHPLHMDSTLRFERFIFDVSANSSAYLQRVDLTFMAKKECLDSIFAKTLDTSFTNCMALKYLKLEHSYPFFFDQYDSARTQFRGITSLPPSLRHFHTGFPIAITESASIDDLDFPNLKNLEQLEITSNVWFIFKNNPIDGLSLNQVKEFSLRLPKLKGIHLNIAHTSLEVVSGSTENLKIIDPELVTKFEKSLLHKKYEGIFLTIETAEL